MVRKSNDYCKAIPHHLSIQSPHHQHLTSQCFCRAIHYSNWCKAMFLGSKSFFPAPNYEKISFTGANPLSSAFALTACRQPSAYQENNSWVWAGVKEAYETRHQCHTQALMWLFYPLGSWSLRNFRFWKTKGILAVTALNVKWERSDRKEKTISNLPSPNGLELKKKVK